MRCCLPLPSAAAGELGQKERRSCSPRELSPFPIGFESWDGQLSQLQMYALFVLFWALLLLSVPFPLPIQRTWGPVAFFHLRAYFNLCYSVLSPYLLPGA